MRWWKCLINKKQHGKYSSLFYSLLIWVIRTENLWYNGIVDIVETHSNVVIHLRVTGIEIKHNIAWTLKDA